MKAENKKQSTIEDDENNVQSVNTSRRLFSKKSLVAPVVMTLANRSAWGGTNMCTQSGFTSYHAQGAVVSHAAHVGVSEWKTPTEWANEPSWPVSPDPLIFSLGQATYNGTKFTSPLWTGEKTLAEVKTFQTSNKVIVLRQTFNGNNNNNTVTLLAELQTGTPGLIDYKIATVLNNWVSPVPSYFLSSTVTLAEFQEFYQNCV